VHVCWHASHAAGKNFAAFGDEFFQEIWVLIIDRFESDVTDLIQTGDELRIDPAAGVVEILNR